LSASRRPAFDIISHSPDQTRALGAQLGRLLSRGAVVLLAGGIGAGKTTFAQGLARPLQTGDRIVSPTFTLVAEHHGVGADGRLLRLYHIDLYRLAGAGDLDTLGLEDYLSDPDAITVIEWPERARALMPDAYLLVDMQLLADTKRNLRLSPAGACYRELVEQFRTEVLGNRG
jgi:tRNA threonylcarbamoyladenosine biosynthesis protein TsaE